MPATNRVSRICSVLLSLAVVGCASEPPPDGGLALPDDIEQAAAAIDQATIERVVRDLADDRMEGRGPGSAGDLLAQQYIEDFFIDLGLQPGGEDGAWRQPFDLIGITTRAPETWTFSSGETATDLAWSDDFIAFGGTQTRQAVIDDAEVVFVGYGIQAPEHDWDDFKDVDLRGKVLLMLNNDPDWDPELFAGPTRLYYGRWDYKYESAARQGAVGAIIIHTTPSAGYPWQVVQTSWTGEQFELPWEGEPRAPVKAWVTDDAAQRLVAMSGFDLEELRQSARTREFRPVPLGLHTSLRLENRLSESQTANVLGLIPGSDPQLAQEVVVFSAHFDHLGMSTEETDADRIYNGAIDNAAGVAMMLAVAKAAMTLDPPPRRSLLFAIVGAEEQGLLGSSYYADHPTFSPGRIAANVNLDGGNPWGRTLDVAYIGYGKSSLDAIAVAAAALQERTVTGDQFPDRGYFYRSDQFNFARIGVPPFYVEAGTNYRGRPPQWGREQVEAWTEHHYHQVSDEVEDWWDWSGFVEDAQLALYCGVAVAQQDELPQWNAGDEFEAARLAALAQRD